VSRRSVAQTERTQVRRPLTAAQARTVAASLELFAQRGVGGTSLQMIADAVGVTKAALFYQFKTKDEIVLAAAEDELSRLDAVLDVAELASAPRRRAVLLAGMVDLAVHRRRTVHVIMGDPVVLGFFADHESYRRSFDRLTDLLMGPGTGPQRHLQSAMFMAALSGAAMHPMLADIDDETLRTQLLRLAKRFR
jgi:AcrR family transcriptional regulator